jgi:UDP-glucose 4-epimerase
MAELCLVTGGAGFIGSHLVAALTASGRRVRVLDDFSTGRRENLDGIRPAPEVVNGDVADPEAVAAAVAGASVVFHLAAVASVQRSVEDPATTHRVCATGTLHVLDAARRAGVRRVVYAASSSCYGVPLGRVQTEDDPLRPLSPYAAAKLAGEMYARSFAACYALETVCLRFFNIFGPRQRADSPYSGVIARFAAAMTAGRRPVVFGDGGQTRDFTHVADAVQALTRAASAPVAAGHAYNIGAGRAVSLLELIAQSNRLLGADLAPEFRPVRSGDVRHSCADIARARADLGYVPGVALEEGLALLLASGTG